MEDGGDPMIDVVAALRSHRHAVEPDDACRQSIASRRPRRSVRSSCCRGPSASVKSSRSPMRRPGDILDFDCAGGVRTAREVSSKLPAGSAV